jgi:two-component system sensor histidine kinase RpfC
VSAIPVKLKQRFSQRPDSEHGQAWVRLAVLTVVLVYLMWHGPGDGGAAQ